MKKIVFSALACVAFAGSTFASNEVNEQVEKFEVVTSSTPCADQWSTDMDVLTGRYPGSQMNVDWERAKEIADELFDKCLEDTYGVNSNNTINNAVISRK